jgi:repressor LexA
MFKENFIKLCAIRNESPSSVCKKIGISSAAFSQWTADTVPRKITLVKLADYFRCSVEDLLADNTEKREPPNTVFLDGQNVHMIPLFENVSAGFGALAINDIVDYIPLYITNPREAAETLCIKVTGDSMYPKIEEGDIIQVHKQDSVDSGDIAVVLLDGEDGRVKRVVYGETWIELHSINPMYKIMRFNGPDVLRVRVLGKVNKVIKEV